jgi:hypothetical protein
LELFALLASLALDSGTFSSTSRSRISSTLTLLLMLWIARLTWRIFLWILEARRLMLPLLAFLIPHLAFLLSLSLLMLLLLRSRVVRP